VLTGGTFAFEDLLESDVLAAATSVLVRRFLDFCLSKAQ
jgi:hypothetical protein